jgi:hypothetical protein
MDFLEEHLEKTAREIHGTEGSDVIRRYADFVERFQKATPKKSSIKRKLPFKYPASLVLDAAVRVLQEDGFDTFSGADLVRNEVKARFERAYDRNSGWFATLPQRHAKLELEFEVAIEVDDDGWMLLSSMPTLVTWEKEFEERVRKQLDKTPESITKLSQSVKPGGMLHNPVLPPGRELTEAFTGNLRDYSGFATSDETKDLQKGVLPLGTWAFAKDPDDPTAAVERGEPLFLSNWRTGAPMIYNGALVCAPQNSGKTQLIMRWALAANRHRYSIFLVDVKGNMYAELQPKLQGKVFCFSTDPAEAGDCINFLAGLHGTTPEDSRRVRQLVEALMPRDGWEQGEQAYFYQNHFNWFSALIHIALLVQYYDPAMFGQGQAHLGHVYQLATEYDQLMACIRNIEIYQARAIAAAKKEPPDPDIKKFAEPGVAYWRSEIALLLDPKDGGQRTADYSYRTLTGAVVNALRPFSRFGTLYSKSGGPRADGSYPPPERSFSLEMLGGAEPVTIILAAREQDLDDATTVLAIAVRKLQQFLFERMKTPGLQPILVLLDETRRIRGFKANEYVTFARQAQAGCVLVYQSLDQIGEEPKIYEILENVGTQIFLGSVAGNSARYLIDMLPRRFRPTFSHTMSFGQGGGPSVQSGQESVEYFSTGELYRLPAGEWPALVYINGLPRRKPFLVDMDQKLDKRPRAASRESGNNVQQI